MRPGLKAAVVFAGIISMGLIARAQQVSTRYAEAEQPGTFSILGFDPETGDIGAAVQSRVFSVGNGVLWVEDGVGAVATQAAVDVGYDMARNGLKEKIENDLKRYHADRPVEGAASSMSDGI